MYIGRVDVTMGKTNPTKMVWKIADFLKLIFQLTTQRPKKTINEKKSRPDNSGHHRSSIKHLKSSRKKSKSGRLFVISDLHLSHRNIIKYCHRPFSNVGAMNKTIIQRWNRVVRPHDTVFFVGDFTMHGSYQYWKRELNGRIIFIKGNHDQNIENARHHARLHYRGYSFYLVHNPHDVPENWNGWTIHGHVHNNQMKSYPLINGKNKSINVSAELTDYYPLDLDKIIDWDLDKIQRKDTLHSPTQYLPHPIGR